MYDKKLNPKYWGEEANPRKDIVLLGNFKLFLFPGSLEKMKEQCGFTDDETPTKNEKDSILAFKVIAHYLKLFKNHVKALDLVMQQFIKIHKTYFLPDLQGDSFYDISLPEERLLNFSNNSNYVMVDNNKTLRMKNRDMKDIVFDPIVKRIFGLIDDQIKPAEKGDKNIDAILMVGGFSQSEYLQRCIKDRY
ncbi:uncharacterized protein EV154DRAFT_561459 [Mucor mucedo]|uniref:uncharacterized protein n=1 Tax=Mucor mucedo TaxID=29922 RepID=UPI002221294F|nr:uncharacterized protein EV154DRAFT_561459 [Mucor mucedo]KAI7893234.1 hypothetical protein EV154DRAFT_561459 [Mucor mucedo]